MTNGVPTEPRPNHEPQPQRPYEDENLAPEKELNPGEIATETEVDLDKEEVTTFPKTNPPEEHDQKIH